MSTLAHRQSLVPRSIDPPSSGSGQPYFLLNQNSRGLWIIHESSGRKGGVFVSRKAALQFARSESRNGNFIVVHVSDDLELGYAA